MLSEDSQLEYNSHHHWSDTNGWPMVEAIECVVLEK